MLWRWVFLLWTPSQSNAAWMLWRPRGMRTGWLWVTWWPMMQGAKLWCRVQCTTLRVRGVTLWIKICGAILGVRIKGMWGVLWGRGGGIGITWLCSWGLRGWWRERCGYLGWLLSGAGGNLTILAWVGLGAVLVRHREWEVLYWPELELVLKITNWNISFEHQNLFCQELYNLCIYKVYLEVIISVCQSFILITQVKCVKILYQYTNTVDDTNTLYSEE